MRLYVERRCAYYQEHVDRAAAKLAERLPAGAHPMVGAVTPLDWLDTQLPCPIRCTASDGHVRYQIDMPVEFVVSAPDEAWDGLARSLASYLRVDR